MLKVLLVVLVFAAVTYALIRLVERRRGTGGAPPRRTRPAPRPEPRPLGPDDDDDFLRDLDRRRRQPEDPDGTNS